MECLMDEKLDYQLSRLQKGKSTCLIKGNWAYLDSRGGLHKLENQGYYFAWKCDMWVSSYWNNKNWCASEISSSKKGLIKEIELLVEKGYFTSWDEGFGKTKNLDLGA